MISVPDQHKATEYLANERTFLAWMRTCIAIISLGFVVAKFGVWVSELAQTMAPGTHLPHSGLSLPVGVSMMAVGGVMAVLAARHYHVTAVAIESGKVGANRNLIITMTIFMAVLSAVLIGYMVLTARQV